MKYEQYRRLMEQRKFQEAVSNFSRAAQPLLSLRMAVATPSRIVLYEDSGTVEVEYSKETSALLASIDAGIADLRSIHLTNNQGISCCH